ncbi:nucleotide-sugar transporter [Saccharata proteae CBS 121410]|uniref:Nucleotide-sugar transporter n=1 Tax=Saccharata proteae CBS 121410 TaxID=1314787 RepID=A0A6A5YC07_9PEZI|nr:nucleotide-sugar transporter [Saccharata proteae CBS 121410]
MGSASERQGASWGGISLRSISLLTLTFQNSALILIMHYSRMMPLTGPRRYFASTAVFLNEVIKLSLSLTMALYEISNTLPSSTPATSLFRTLSTAVFTGDSWKLAVPAMLYTLQNSLQYLAVSNLDAATFQVTYQLKILTTALFSVMLLGRTLSLRKWLSLVLLMLGIAIVQIPSGDEAVSMDTLRDESQRFFWPRSIEELRDLGSSTAKQLMRRSVEATVAITKRSATYEGIEEDVAMQHPQLNASLGLLAVIVACVLSGLAGVYFEKILKESTTPASLWVRNVQLSFYSLFPALFLGVAFVDGEDITRYGFFVGYNWVVWAAIIMQAFGGVVVALVVQYADNIAKNFATSISIIISCLFSVYLFSFDITLSYIVGTSIVLFSTYLYTKNERGARPPPIRIADYEKTIVGGEPSYFDVAPGSARSAKTPKGDRSNALGVGVASSRPSTPNLERQGFRAAKRDE